MSNILISTSNFIKINQIDEKYYPVFEVLFKKIISITSQPMKDERDIYFYFRQNFNTPEFINLLIDCLEESGFNVDYYLLNALISKLEHRYFRNDSLGIWSNIPKSIEDSISSIVRKIQPKSILDPHCKFGQLLYPHTKSKTIFSLIGITPSDEFKIICQRLDKDNSIEWHTGNFDSTTLENLSITLDQKFDMVVCSSILGHQNFNRWLKNVIFKKVKNGGYICIWTSRGDAIRLLHKEDSVNVEAYLETSENFPGTSVSSCLMVLKKGNVNKTFVGQSNEEISSKLPPLNNYLSGKSSSIFSDGNFIEDFTIEKFNVLNARSATERFTSNISNNLKGLKRYKISDLVDVERIYSKSKSSDFLKSNHKSHFVYIPLIGKGPAVNTIENFVIKQNNYLILKIKDTSILNPAFLTEYLNNEFGEILRRTSTSTSTIPKLQVVVFKGNYIYLPNINDQIKAIELNQKFLNVSITLEQARKSIWTDMSRIEEIQIESEEWLLKDDIEEWIRTLPYALASILDYYRSRTAKSEKIRTLKHFFEAHSLFMTSIYLSALGSNRILLDEYREKSNLIDDIKSLSQSANIGITKKINENLSKKFRSKLNGNKDEKELVIKAFQIDDTNFLDMLFTKEITMIMEKYIVFRNNDDHKITPHTDELYNLETLLTEFRKIYGFIWKSYRIIYPTDSKVHKEIDGGIRREITYKDSTGITSNFRIQSQTFTKDLFMDRSYLHQKNSKIALELFPLIRLSDTPSNTADTIYFYSSKDEFTSYHHVNDPTKNEKYEILDIAFQNLLKEDT